MRKILFVLSLLFFLFSRWHGNAIANCSPTSVSASASCNGTTDYLNLSWSGNCGYPTYNIVYWPANTSAGWDQVNVNGTSTSIPIASNFYGGGSSAKVGADVSNSNYTYANTVTLPACPPPPPPPTPTSPPPPTPTSPPPVPTDTPIPAVPTPYGNHDGVDCSQGILGWACQKGYYGSSNRVDVYIDGPYGTGTYIGSANAGINRSDLTAAKVCGSNPNHGFDLTPSQMTGLKMPHDGQNHTYYAYAINASGNNQNPLLWNTPKSATCAQDPVSLTLVLGLPGIGYNGSAGVAPKHLSRSASVQLYDASVTNPSGPGTSPLTTATGTVTFDSSSDSNAGYFVGTVSVALPTSPPSNNQYKILVQISQYLYQLAVVTPPPSDASQANIFTLTSGQPVTTAPFSLISGDVYTANGGLNHLNLDDYNLILTCFNNSSDSTCTKTPDGISYPDLDDDGSMDIVDLNLWLRSLSQLQKAQAPGYSTGDCQGD